MKFSTLRRFLKYHAGSDEALDRHYVRLSHDKDVNAEPLFWLQYAIMMKTFGDLPKARLFLNAGYKRASEIDKFKTFQLDTQALSIYLLEEIERRDPTVEGLEEILNSIRSVANMIADESHRYHAIEVIGEVPAFIDARRWALKDSEKIAVVFELNRASQALATLSLEDQIYSGSELVRNRIETAVASLVG